jgi:hypothetical protein
MVNYELPLTLHLTRGTEVDWLTHIVSCLKDNQNTGSSKSWLDLPLLAEIAFPPLFSLWISIHPRSKLRHSYLRKFYEP